MEIQVKFGSDGSRTHIRTYKYFIKYYYLLFLHKNERMKESGVPTISVRKTEIQPSPGKNIKTTLIAIVIK